MLQPAPAYKNLITNEILAGVTTGLLVIPEVLLFAFLIKVYMKKIVLLKAD